MSSFLFVFRFHLGVKTTCNDCLSASIPCKDNVIFQWLKILECAYIRHFLFPFIQWWVVSLIPWLRIFGIVSQQRRACRHYTLSCADFDSFGTRPRSVTDGSYVVLFIYTQRQTAENGLWCTTSMFSRICCHLSSWRQPLGLKWVTFPW